jgi:hypothetical protein
MILNEFLTAKDRIALKKLPLTLRLRKKNACLVLLGVDTIELGDAFSQYLSSCLEGDDHIFYTPATELILPEVMDPNGRIPRAAYIIVNLYDRPLSQDEKENISAGLLLYRDYIPEYRLKLIFLLSHDLMRYLQTQAYDFFPLAIIHGFFLIISIDIKERIKETKNCFCSWKILTPIFCAEKRKKASSWKKSFPLFPRPIKKAKSILPWTMPIVFWNLPKRKKINSIQPPPKTVWA